VAVVSALVALILLVVAALVVDIGATWATRGQLQVQADKAALLAAHALPVTDGPSRVAAARTVAGYVACHPVPGQHRLDPAIPECPEGWPEPPADTDPELTGYAHRLLDADAVTFPTSTRVRVRTPPARVRYSFGRAAGAQGSTQTKSATAQVSSPGDVLPFALSLTCVTASLATAPVVGDPVSQVLPVNYLTPGSEHGWTGDLAPTDAVAQTVWTEAPTSAQVTVSSVEVVGGQVVVTADFGGLAGLLSLGPEVAFRRGDLGPVVVTAALGATGVLSVPLPDEVAAHPGVWELKVRRPGGLLTSPVWSAEPATVEIPPSAGDLSDAVDLDDFLSCARPIVSPRADTPGVGAGLTANIRAGLDHRLAQHPQLLDVAGTLNLDQPVSGTVQDLGDVVADPSLLLSCHPENSVNRHDVPGQIDPTCVRVNSSRNWSAEFTAGFLTEDGRLSCAEHPCRGDTTLPFDPGNRYNADSLRADFLAPSSLLDDPLFLGLDTFLLPRLPVVTPTGAVDPAVYESPRFFWLPVVSTAFTAHGTEDYPVFTFRPVFLTRERPETTGALVDELALGLVNRLQSLSSGSLGWLLSLLGVDDLSDALGVEEGLDDLLDSAAGGSTMERAGLVLDPDDTGRELTAVRFMTLAPGALPPVALDYDGPTTDYLGMGPRVVRLVE
jgi:hypothetical protein